MRRLERQQEHPQGPDADRQRLAVSLSKSHARPNTGTVLVAHRGPNRAQRRAQNARSN